MSKGTKSPHHEQWASYNKTLFVYYVFGMGLPGSIYNRLIVRFVCVCVCAFYVQVHSRNDMTSDRLFVILFVYWTDDSTENMLMKRKNARIQLLNDLIYKSAKKITIDNRVTMASKQQKNLMNFFPLSNYYHQFIC